MGDWNLSLTDYWDQRKGAINRGAIRLGELSGRERVEACAQIRYAVHQRVMSEN